MAVAGAALVLFRLLKQPPVLGYLLAGLIIGPFTLPNLDNINTGAALAYNNIPVQYLVTTGNNIPGSSLNFVAILEPGGAESVPQRMAKLAGIDGYPYFALEDSIVWIGQILPNVYIRYDLHLKGLESYGMTVAGTATLWVFPVGQ